MVVFVFCESPVVLLLQRGNKIISNKARSRHLLSLLCPNLSLSVVCKGLRVRSPSDMLSTFIALAGQMKEQRGSLATVYSEEEINIVVLEATASLSLSFLELYLK